jgi:hypothetical protein
MKRKLLLLITVSYISLTGYAQYTTDKVVGKKNAEVIDSLKKTDYPYLLPIWGKKVAQKGFKLPKSAGFSAQYLWQQSDILINNLQVGFNNGPMHNLDEIVRFDHAQTTTSGINVRPDFWLFPFLNVYAIFAKSNTSTAINAGVYIPDSSNKWNRIADINTKANFDATTYGFGFTPTIGVGGFFLALDMNFSWSDIAELDKPAFASVFGPRLGKNITFPKHPERQWAIWVGGFRVDLNSGTTGSLPIGDVLPINEWQDKVNNGYTKVNESQQKVDTWWNGLTPQQQKNPVNIAKHETTNAVLARAGGVLDAATRAINTAASSSVQYSLDKQPLDKWNFIIGTQFQLNRSLMFRAEYGFLGARNQFIGGIQYRFDL